MQPFGEASAQAVERVFRQECGRILATLIRVFGDFDLAEDALQEAFIAPVEHCKAPAFRTTPRPGSLPRHATKECPACGASACRASCATRSSASWRFRR
jgi:hypothetical protein